MQSKSKYTFWIQKLFPKIASFMRWRLKTWWRVRGHKWRYTMAHTRCMLDKQDYMHTRPGARTYTQICNIHIDLHRNNDSRTRLNVTLNVHCLVFDFRETGHCSQYPINTARAVVAHAVRHRLLTVEALVRSLGSRQRVRFVLDEGAQGQVVIGAFRVVAISISPNRCSMLIHQ